MGLETNWWFPKVSAAYCYRVILLSFFLLSIPLIYKLDYLFILRILALVCLLLLYDYLLRKIFLKKFSAGLLYLFSVIIPTALMVIPSINFLMNTTEISLINLIEGYFAFMNFISASPNLIALIMIIGGGLQVAPVFEDLFKNSVEFKEIKVIFDKDIKFSLIFLIGLTFYLYTRNLSQIYVISFGILNTIYPPRFFSFIKSSVSKA